MTLKDNLWKEPKIFSSLMRRPETANYDESFEPPSQWNDVDRTTWQGVEEDLAAAAGIPTNMIVNVQQGQLIPDYQPTAKETGNEERAEEVQEMERRRDRGRTRDGKRKRQRKCEIWREKKGHRENERRKKEKGQSKYEIQRKKEVQRVNVRWRKEEGPRKNKRLRTKEM